MTVLLKAKSGKRKPRPFYSKKVKHPLAYGLVHAWLFNEVGATKLRNYGTSKNHGTLKHFDGGGSFADWSGNRNPFKSVGYSDGSAVIVGTINDASISTTNFDCSQNLSNVDDIYNGARITIISGTRAGDTGVIADYTGSTRTITTSALAGTPATGDFFKITPRIQDATLDECSAVASSHANSDVLYCIEDSGGSQTIWALSAISGATIRTYTPKYPSGHASAGSTITLTDWEDVCCGVGPVAGTKYLYLSDAGDNNYNRASKQYFIYRFVEPTVVVGAAANLTADAVIRFTYNDNDWHNCETIMVDPISGNIYLVTKNDTGNPGSDPINQAYVYKILKTDVENAANLSAGIISVVATLVYTLDNTSGGGTWINANGVSSGDISSDGLKIVLRDSCDDNAGGTYTQEAKIWDRSPSETIEAALARTPATLTLPAQSVEGKGEGITFVGGDQSYTIYTTAEAVNAPIRVYKQTSPWRKNEYGPCVYFNGDPLGGASGDVLASDGDFVELDRSFNIAGDFTFTWQGKVTSNAINKETIIGDGVNTGYIRLESTTALRIRHSVSNLDITLSPAITINDLATFSIVRNGSTITIYRNGVSIGTGTTANPINGLQFIGVKAYTDEASTKDNYYEGEISCILVHNRALRTRDIQLLAKDPYLMFRSDDRNALTMLPQLSNFEEPGTEVSEETAELPSTAYPAQLGGRTAQRGPTAFISGTAIDNGGATINFGRTGRGSTKVYGDQMKAISRWGTVAAQGGEFPGNVEDPLFKREIAERESFIPTTYKIDSGRPSATIGWDYASGQPNSITHDFLGTELVTNGTFDESLLTGWSVSSGVDGDTNRVGIPQNKQIAQNITLVANTDYKFTFDVTPDDAEIWFYFMAEDDTVVHSGKSEGAGTFVSLFNSGAYTELGLILLAKANGTHYLDNISLRAVTTDIQSTFGVEAAGATFLQGRTISNKRY